MHALYHSYLLPWTQIQEEVERLKKFVVIAVVIAFLGGLVIPFLPVPKEDVSKIKQLPPRLAQLVMEKKKPKPKPVPPVKKEEKKKEKKPEKKKEKEPEKKKEKPKPIPKPEKTRAQIIDEARKKVKRTGLLAFADDLSDLRDSKVTKQLDKRASLSKGGVKASEFSRSILTSGQVTSGSGGIDTSSLSTGVGRSNLAGRDTTQVDSDIDKIARAGGTLEKGTGKNPARTVEDVKIVMDRNKGAIYQIYNRFLRKDPSLEGKVVFELTIDPSGAVVNVKVISSDLKSPELERKLMARIRSFNFGAKDVDETIVEFPIDFLPS